ncbi:MAG TPA: hypothetical protein VHP83_21580 [Aggregatilineaceae bacterium]|nr:hypothetical protein [Aggregatilineaceae bacterium]
MDTLFRIHGEVRWLILIVAAITVIYLVTRWLQKKPYDQRATFLTTLFGVTLDIQMLLGLIYFVWSGIDWDYWPRQRFEHLAVMFVAVGIAHMPRRWQTQADTVRYRNAIAVIIAVLVLIVVGILLLPGGSSSYRWDFGD